MSAALTVACVLRGGGQYTPRHAHRLRENVRRWLPIPHRFVAFTDVLMDGMECVSLEVGWPGWWSKFALFEPGRFGADELVVYLDLDVVPIGDLSWLAGYRGERCMLRDLYRPTVMMSSSIMLWRGDAMEPVWRAFVADPERAMREHRARSDYFTYKYVRPCDWVQDLWPGRVVSFKAHVRSRGGVPAGAAIVDFHGRPKPWDLPEPYPLRLAWEGVRS